MYTRHADRSDTTERNVPLATDRLGEKARRGRFRRRYYYYYYYCHIINAATIKQLRIPNMLRDDPLELGSSCL